ncbi:MAG: GNAT family N-acetyltransferase [Spirochaetia bacterium]|nr:GNAT family N-acetyltransferase [Spirochaetia bacterium]
MIWQRVTQDNFYELIRFILPHEYLCVNFTSRLLNNKRPELPPPREAALFIGKEDPPDSHEAIGSSGTPSRVCAAVLITSKGLLIPVHEEGITLTADQLLPLLTQIYRYVRKIYCVIGMENTVKQYEPHLHQAIDTYRSHYLMLRPKQRPLAPLSIPVKIQIHHLTEKQIKHIFPLEKAYQYEEVVVHPERFNSAAYMLHFRKVVKSQKVLFASLNGVPISKAGTNAIGINHTQIGGVFTTPEYRGHGVARALMHRLIEEIQVSDRTAVLFVRTSNSSAIQLYRRLNFDIIGRYQISYTRVE